MGKDVLEKGSLGDGQEPATKGFSNLRKLAALVAACVLIQGLILMSPMLGVVLMAGLGGWLYYRVFCR